jgi:hypothetical protein
VAGLLLAQGQSFHFASGVDEVDGTGVTAWTLLPNGDLEFTGGGAWRCVIDSKSRGMRLSANDLAGKILRAADKTYYLSEFHAKGAANLAYDSDRVNVYRRSKDPKFPFPKTKARTEILSETIDYKGTDALGTLTFPGPMTIQSQGSGVEMVTQDGRQMVRNYNETMTLTGASGVLQIDPRSHETGTVVQSGELKGPVHLVFARSETLLDSIRTTKYTLDLTCDALQIVPKGDSRDLIATGTVVIHVTDNDQVANMTADKLAVTMDKNGRFNQIKGTGSPTTTTIDLKGGKG